MFARLLKVNHITDGYKSFKIYELLFDLPPVVIAAHKFIKFSCFATEDHVNVLI